MMTRREHRSGGVKGTDVYASIESTQNAVQSELDILQKGIRKNEHSIESLTSDRERVIDSMAQLYLPSLDAVRTVWAVRSLQKKLQGIVQSQQQRRETIEQQRTAISSRSASLESRAQSLLLEREERVRQFDEAVSSTRTALEKDAHYGEMRDQLYEAERGFKVSDERVTLAIEEFNRKRPRFEKDPVFSYLLGQQRSDGGFFGMLDGWAARVSGFTTNKKNYDFLEKALNYARDSKRSREERLSAVKRSMTDYEQSVAGSFEVPVRERLAAEAARAYEDAVNILEENKARILSLVEEERQILSGDNPYYAQAKKALSEYLKGETMRSLRERAQQTPSTEDDGLVDRLQSIDKEIADLRYETKNLKDNFEQKAVRLNELTKISKHVSNNSYSRSRSRFDDGFEIDTLLQGVLLGTVSADDVNASMDQNHYSYRPPESSNVYGYGSSSYGGSSGHSSSNSDFGGGGSFSSNDSFGGGSFSSGDSF